MSMLPIIFLDYIHFVAGYTDAVSYCKNCGLYNCLTHHPAGMEDSQINHQLVTYGNLSSRYYYRALSIQ